MTTDVKPLPTIGLDRVYVAQVLTDAFGSGATYGTPIALPAAVELSENPSADVSAFHADDKVYVQTSRPGETQVPATIANIDPETYALLMGHTYTDTNGLVVESQDDTPAEFAFGYRKQLPNGKYEYVWYLKGIFTKASKTINTKSARIQYNTTPIQFNAQPTEDGLLRRTFTTDDPNSPVGLTDTLAVSSLTGWFSDPNYIPVAPGTAISDFAAATGAGDSGSIDCTFTAPTGATRVVVQVYDPVSGKYYDATTSATLTESSTSATVTGLTAGNTYTLRLVVTSGASNGISNTDSAAAKA